MLVAFWDSGEDKRDTWLRITFAIHESSTLDKRGDDYRCAGAQCVDRRHF